MKKKKKLNNELYKTHLKDAQEWSNTWYTILNCIHDSIIQDVERPYQDADDCICCCVLTECIICLYNCYQVLIFC